MFIGFSFSNLITCIIEFIQSVIEKKLGKHLPSEKQRRESKEVLEWIIYLCLMATAIYFSKEVIEKFFGQSIGMKQNMEKIESHPTITICPFLHCFCAKADWIGDGECDAENYNAKCEWDGGDCCSQPSWIGDGSCDDEANNEICKWDGGDCCGDDVNTDYCEYCECDIGTHSKYTKDLQI